MSSVFDQTAYLIETYGTQPRSKLLRILYLCQVVHIIRYEKPLFDNKMEIRENCPVVLDLFDLIKYRIKVSLMLEGDSRLVTNIEQQTIDYVMELWGSAPGTDIMEAIVTDPLYKEIWKRSAKRKLEGKDYAKMTPDFILKNHRGDRWQTHINMYLAS